MKIVDVTPEPDSLPDWEDIETAHCPVCGSGNFEYSGEAYDDEEHLGAYYHCEECGHGFTLSDMDDD